MPKIGQNIRNWMGYTGVGFTRLFTEGNFPKSTLSDWLNDKSEPKPKNLDTIARVLGIKTEDLFRNPYQENSYEPKPKEKLVPVLGYAYCGEPVESWAEHTTQYYDAGDIRGMINPFILIAKGRSMFPYIYERDKIICSLIEDRKKIKDEMLVVVAFKTMPDTAEANAKLIIPKKKYCTLYSINSKFKPVDVPYTDIEKIYEVVKIVRDPKQR